MEKHSSCERRSTEEPTPRPGADRERRPDPEPFDDPVDEASAESMVASDPPARGLHIGGARPPRERAGQEGREA